MKIFFTLLLFCFVPLVEAQVDAPPAYPREGAIKLLENDQVIVWNISWLKQDYPVHRHRYDHTGVYYEPGDRRITSDTGEVRAVHTDAWNISFQLAGVTHTESGTSDAPLRAVFIQIKRPVLGSVIASTVLPRFPADAPLERLSNERVRVWEYGADSNVDSAHYHGFDAVMVWFDGANQPNVHFVSRGAVHQSDIPTAAARVFVFELL